MGLQKIKGKIDPNRKGRSITKWLDGTTCHKYIGT